METKFEKLDLLSFHKLISAAYDQGLVPLFSDADVCKAEIDMFPDETTEVEEGLCVTLFDTHYSDKTGPSGSNELISLGTVDAPVNVDMRAFISGNKVVRIEIDKGPGQGKASITFVDTKPSGVDLPGHAPARPSDEEEHALQLLDTVSGELVAHLERMSDEATEMLRAADGCAGMPPSLVDDIVCRWSEALLRGGPSNWRAEYEKLKNGE